MAADQTPEQVIADALDEYEALDSMRHLAIILTKALRAAGLLPGPDDIVVHVSKAARDHLVQFGCAHGDRVGCSPGNCWALKSIALAALSQPKPPAQEQQT